jgi:hypothetical protein
MLGPVAAAEHRPLSAIHGLRGIRASCPAQSRPGEVASRCRARAALFSRRQVRRAPRPGREVAVAFDVPPLERTEHRSLSRGSARAPVRANRAESAMRVGRSAHPCALAAFVHPCTARSARLKRGAQGEAEYSGQSSGLSCRRAGAPGMARPGFKRSRIA